MIFSSLTVNFAQAQTVYYTVALDGSGNFKDIQSAINAVPSGSTALILVKAGTYVLNPTTSTSKPTIVKSGITIRGSGIDKTIIKCFPTMQPAGSNRRAPAFLSTSSLSNFVLEDMTIIQNGTPDNLGYNAIDLRGDSNTNIRLSNLKVTDAFGACISVNSFNGLTVENCQLVRAWTGISMSGGRSAVVRGNIVSNTKGNGVFTQVHGYQIVSGVVIEDNRIENAGDTGIDITSVSSVGYHSDVTIQRNTLVNSHIRVSGTKHVKILDNTLTGGKSVINVDAGQLRPIDIVIQGNYVTTSRDKGIRIAGAQDCVIQGNQITMLTPTLRPQTGISVASYGTVLVEGNTISSPADYGIDFCGWWISDHTMTIKGNTILNPGKIGIYDNGKGQGAVVVDSNIIWDKKQPFVSIYGIRTDYTDNKWTIKYNHVYAGSIAYISAPKSLLIENVYKPPSSVQHVLVIDVQGSGTTNPLPETYTYNEGDAVQVDAQPATGWKLGHWLLDGDDVGSADPYSLTMYADHSLTAVFTQVVPVVFEDGFESGSFSAWTSKRVSTSESASVSTAERHHGSYAGYFTSNGERGIEYASVYKDIAPSSELYTRGYFYVSRSGISGNDDRFYLIGLYSGANSVAYAGWRMTGGVVKWALVVKDGTNVVSAYSTSSPLSNKWYCVELRWRSGSTDGLGELYIDGVRVCSIGGKNTAYYGNVNRVQFGLPYLNDCGSTTVYGDCCVVSKASVGT
jgi:hypothetical protein